mgnify:CR=1 FL=1
MKQINSLTRRILAASKKNNNKNQLVLTLKTQAIVTLMLHIENSLQKKDVDPTKEAINALEDLLKKISDLNKIEDFGKKVINDKKFIKEKSHQKLFEDLWVNYTFDEYKKERLGRYTKRIKINKLGKLIKNKDVIDFGCGHGQFLTSMLQFGTNKCLGIDYGEKSIAYAKNIQKKLGISKNELNFKVASVYNSQEENNSYDFAIQNGVFHHLDDELKAYKEVNRVLKKDGYFWVYSVGKGGIKDITAFMCWKLLKDIDKSFVVKTINSLGLSTNKEYYLGDSLNALYNYRTKESLLNILKKSGFYNFKQLNGGYPTDFDEPFKDDKFFKLKYGSGDLRFLCQKK